MSSKSEKKFRKQLKKLGKNQYAKYIFKIARQRDIIFLVSIAELLIIVGYIAWSFIKKVI